MIEKTSRVDGAMLMLGVGARRRNFNMLEDDGGSSSAAKPVASYREQRQPPQRFHMINPHQPAYFARSSTPPAITPRPSPAIATPAVHQFDGTVTPEIAAFLQQNMHLFQSKGTSPPQ